MHGEPHACGEYSRSVAQRQRACGSSPRVWGIPSARRLTAVVKRFIPTRVGNTMLAIWPVIAVSVHPHACGEYRSFSYHWSTRAGSSPRVWGIRGRRRSGNPWRRFIPTRVGNTLQEDARNNRLLAELQRATEPCVLQACSDDDKKGKELCKAAPSPRKKLPGRAVTLS